MVDVTDVERVDTAALQLLYAFARDRKSRGLDVQWQGDSRGWREGTATLDPSAGRPATSANS